MHEAAATLELSSPPDGLATDEPGLAERAARHRIGRVDGAPGGPLLIVVGGVHGNEPAGIAAVGRVLAELELGPVPIVGSLVALAGNLGALEARRRFLDADLNRLWTPARLAAARAGTATEQAEAVELAELDFEIETLLAEAPGRVCFLDLHTTSGPGLPFTVLDDALPSRRFALALPVPVVLGLEEELAGTLVFHLSARGVTSVAFEGGRHDDPQAVDRCEAAIWVALAAAGLLPRTWRARAEIARRLLVASRGPVPHLVEVVYRHAIVPADGYRMRPGYTSFHEVAKGEALGDDRRGPVLSPERGMLLMPLYQPQGDDGFFLVQPVRRAWFELSAALRSAQVERWLARLPGVRRDPDDPGAFRVDRRIARYFARELFHLLGYRQLPDESGRARFRRRADPRL